MSPRFGGIPTRHPARPRRPRLLPAQTLRRQTPQRRRRLRRPTPLQHHPRHAQNPNPLPTNPTPTPAPSRLERLDNKTGTPPFRRQPGRAAVVTSSGWRSEQRPESSRWPSSPHRLLGPVPVAVALGTLASASMGVGVACLLPATGRAR